MSTTSSRNITIGLSIIGLTASLLTVSGLAVAETTRPAAASDDAAQDLDGRWSTNIVGGTKAPKGSWPSIAALANRGGSFKKKHFCGGTLIHRKWVVTAAHCMAGEEADRVHVAIGRTRLGSRQGEVIRARKIVMHAKWNKRTDHNDIAIVKLRDRANQPVMRMVGKSQESAYDPGRAAEIAGWGATTPRGKNFPNNLRQAEIEMISRHNCRSLWDPLWPNEQVCAGIWPDGGIDTCSGDSGGPLTITVRGKRRLAGLTSFGGDRCADKQQAVYTKLAAYRNWIRKSIRRN